VDLRIKGIKKQRSRKNLLSLQAEKIINHYIIKNNKKCRNLKLTPVPKKGSPLPEQERLKESMRIKVTF
jgi:hypothetical protein